MLSLWFGLVVDFAQERGGPAATRARCRCAAVAARATRQWQNSLDERAHDVQTGRHGVSVELALDAPVRQHRQALFVLGEQGVERPGLAAVTHRR